MDRPIKCGLVSVSNKTGIVEFCRGLSALGIEILSTGGTAKLLADNNIAVIEVSDYTGFPEMMDGRVKTLHPKVHGGILGRRGIDDAVMGAHGIEAIDLVVVNLYPFEETIANPQCDLATAIENIDIGGPTMIRAAAKNYLSVSIIVDPNDYSSFLDQLKSGDQCVSKDNRFKLAKKSFEHTASYDFAIAKYLNQLQGHEFPDNLLLQFKHAQSMRYGENPHQKAAFYTDKTTVPGTIAAAKQLQGKALSYNNIADTDAALECVKLFPPSSAACVIVKHANPCGVALAETLFESYERAYATDPTSAFGGIIAFNRTLDSETAAAIVERQFVEVVIAPDFDNDATAILKTKENIRVLACGEWPQITTVDWDFKRVAGGGLLVQDRDAGIIDSSNLNVVSQRSPSNAEMDDLLFAWQIVKFVKSNAIVYCKNKQTIGIGAGQMSRVYSARIASIKAQDEGLEVSGSVMASDAFFPFRDSIDSAAQCGIRAVIQPGGSLRDEEVIAAADEHDMAMIFTGMRHFRH